MWQRDTPTYWEITIMTDTTNKTPLYQILSYLVNFVANFHKGSLFDVANISKVTTGDRL